MSSVFIKFFRFFSKIAETRIKCRAAEFPPSARRIIQCFFFLERRRWEGGVQEIRETAERIVIRAEGEELGLEELAAFFPEESLRPQNRGIVEDSIESQLRRLLGAGMTKEKIAEEMGVSRATLYRWIEKFKLNESALRERESAG